MKRKLTPSKVGAAAAVAVVLVSAAACIPAADGTISACRRGDGSIRLIDSEGGAACGDGETLVTWNQAGEVGPAGPAGPAGPTGPAGPAGPQGGGGVVEVVTNSGHGLNPGTNLDVIGVHATVVVPAGGSVVVDATKVIGTLGLDPPAVLDAWVCHRPAGSARSSLVTVGPAHNVQLWSRGRTPLTLAAAIEGLPAGSHEVGLCAQATNLRWNDNHQSSVTATVIDP